MIEVRIEELINRAVAGDTEAFGGIYARYRTNVYRRIWSMVSNNAIAEDITSETFIRAFRAIGGFQADGGSIKAWLNTIAKNLVVEHYRSRHYKNLVMVDHVLDDSITDIGADEVVLNQLPSENIRGILRSRVREDWAEILIARYVEDLTVSETAEKLALRETQVIKNSHRARRVLENSLTPEELKRELERV